LLAVLGAALTMLSAVLICLPVKVDEFVNLFTFGRGGPPVQRNPSEPSKFFPTSGAAYYRIQGLMLACFGLLALMAGIFGR
jgi:hypothetical protein